MRFSVIIPLYNKVPFVEKAVCSVLSQTYLEWDLVIVDDGSTDGSAEVAEKIIECCSDRVKLIHQTNAGVGVARNNGVDASSGDFLAFLDADDWWESTFLEEMDKLITRYPNAGLYACNYTYWKPGKTRLAVNHPTGLMDYPKTYLENGMMPVCTGSVVIPRKIFAECGRFPTGIRLGEDFLLWSKIAMRYDFAFLDTPLMFYNNDVPVTLRATRNLHDPKYHMLFNLGLDLSSADGNWKALIDKLRVNTLLDYWVDPKYHDIAVKELEKVDWPLQPASIVRLYKTPVWVLRTKRSFMQVGSYLKQLIIRKLNIR